MTEPRRKAKPKAAPKRKPRAKTAAKAPTVDAAADANDAAADANDAAADAKARERESYPERLRPPERIRAQWTKRGRATGEKGYAQRWAAFWKRTVLALKDQETWREHDIVLVAEYVKRCRLVELHGELAEAAPYGTSETGVVRAHPGFERALAEAREARAVAVELKLTPRARENAGIQIPDVPGPDDGDVKPDGVKWVDDQIDPDGRQL